MDPATLVVSALLAGIAAGTSETAGTAIKDAYSALKALLRNQLTEESAKVALAEFENDPETWEAPLKKTITALALDEEILKQSRLVLELAQSSVGTAASKYDITIKRAQNVAIGDQAQARYTEKS